MKRLYLFLGKRLLFVIPQLFGITLVSFLFLQLIPGDPAVLMAGPFATPSVLENLRAELGLDKSLFEQFLIYISNVLRGDLGNSWQTTRPVAEDLLQRFPATLELIILSLLLALAIGIPLGRAGARLKKGITRRTADYYGLFAGALPDFWLGLVFIYILLA